MYVDVCNTVGKTFSLYILISNIYFYFMYLFHTLKKKVSKRKEKRVDKKKKVW